MGMIENTRLGRYGIWTFDFEDQPAGLIRDSVRELEELGWPAIWIPESERREALTHAGFLLAATERLTVVNGIAQIWAREPQWTHHGARLLAEAYPDRHLLGLGYGGGRPGTRPLRAVTDYLDALDAFPETPVRRLLAAYGPKMLELARDRSAGAHTYHVTPEHTAQAREILGDGPFLGVEHAVLFETDAVKAREIARAHLHIYLTTEYNVAKFLRLGYTEADIDGGRGSDRLVDDLVFWGDLGTITERLSAHLDAGADHVGIQVLGAGPNTSVMPHWRRLAEALLPAGVA
ncbi:TIGR03620 family F420-dependent LLM class oxidoreductase [Amycolatopsis sp. SID8362]|uniref:TIGR03620 family F420-dependent LLM class oxidoreductase n=1 Tax=Amycolatopsis sp. SID8362 TaxID=2690346 RepID=UPI00136C62C0|nr:TIGR03620 family F420-dependent LLM class oxidoreductase [Amycolatopsis sp. SID8362]NBH07284.1 TIGR03620 family F420-dependent LLM class oxidoreductase [Amycolatopsis sp. SID8362]NED43980.1 TIGR03620 family F420-dependent LLM class oxidoreductase [Amycolatopsis sp. SID8362]